MASSRDTAEHKPRLSITQRASDFDRRGPRLMQFGACCCCCCCCLHWIGAAAGGVAGIQTAFNDDVQKTGKSPSKQLVYSMAMVGLMVVICAVPFLCIAPLSGLGPAIDVIAVPLVICAFVPSLVFIPIGIVIIISASLTRQSDERTREFPQAETNESSPLELALRITWMAFLLSSLGAGVGYLVMLWIGIMLQAAQG